MSDVYDIQTFDKVEVSKQIRPNEFQHVAEFSIADAAAILLAARETWAVLLAAHSYILDCGADATMAPEIQRIESLLTKLPVLP
jgi:hypothetical protein